jgi:hypothetical protein
MPKSEHIKRGKYIRIDLSWQNVSTDEGSRTLRAILTPDVRRYEEITKRGKIYWRDRFLGYVFGENKLKQTV